MPSSCLVLVYCYKVPFLYKVSVGSGMGRHIHDFSCLVVVGVLARPVRERRCLVEPIRCTRSVLLSFQILIEEMLVLLILLGRIALVCLPSAPNKDCAVLSCAYRLCYLTEFLISVLTAVSSGTTQSAA